MANIEHVTSHNDQPVEHSDSQQPSQFCIDVLADAWGKKHHEDPSDYKDAYKSWLTKPDATQEDLNRAWEENLVGVENKRAGQGSGDRLLAKLRQAQHCE